MGTSIAEYTGFLSSQMGPTPLAFERAFRLPNMNFHPEAFFSIQLEKVGLTIVGIYTVISIALFSSIVLTYRASAEIAL